MDDKPTVNWVYPEAKMAEYAELKNVDLGEMVLLHKNDSHFNLVVSGDSDLATLGSWSDHQNSKYWKNQWILNNWKKKLKNAMMMT